MAGEGGGRWRSDSEGAAVSARCDAKCDAARACSTGSSKDRCAGVPAVTPPLTGAICPQCDWHARVEIAGPFVRWALRQQHLVRLPQCEAPATDAAARGANAIRQNSTLRLTACK